MQIYSGKKLGQTIFAPVKESSIITQAVTNKKTVVINEPNKDRLSINEVRKTLNMGKLHNLMLVPFGENEGKRGGAMLLILMNKFCIGDGDKPVFDKFDVSTTPVTNKIFQQVFLHSLAYKKLKNRLDVEIGEENVVFNTMNEIMQVSTMFDFCKSIETNFAELF